MIIGSFIILFIVCFLLGSIPWGVVVSKAFFHRDIRSVGSGNIGATNAMRAVGKKGGIAVFLLDFGKGVASGAIGYFLFPWFLSAFFLAEADTFIIDHNLTLSQFSTLCASVSFLACTWGHIFSPWLKFKGGKGVAVAVGCEFFALGVLPTLIEITLFALVVLIFRYVSLGSVLAAVACPILALIFLSGQWASIVLMTIAACTVIWAHRGNIKRLVNRSENRIGSKEKKVA